MLMRLLRRIAWTVGAVSAALLFFAGGVFLRLLMGPISLGPVAGAIEDSINRAVTGFVVRFDSAVLEWSRMDGRVYLTVLGTKVFDLNGRIVAQAPKANLDFDEAGLLAGHLSLKRFALVGVQLTGVRTADGVIRLGFGLQRDDSDLLKTVREMLQNGGNTQSSLDGLSIRNARLAFRDEPTGLFVVSPDTNFTLESSVDGLNASVDSAIEISGIASRFAARAKLRDDGMPQRGTVEIQNLSLPALTKNNPALAYLQPYAISSNAEGSFELDDTGNLRAATFHVEGTGTVTTSAMKTPVSLDEFDVAGSYDGTQDRVVLDSITLQGSPVSAKANARFTFTRKDGVIATASGDIAAQNINLAFPNVFRQDLTLTRFALKADYDVAGKRVAWERAIINGVALSADISGAVTFTEGVAPALNLSGTLEPITVRDLLYYWPIGVGEGAEEWIRSQVIEGRAGPVRIDANFPADTLDKDAVPDDSLSVTFPFEGMSVRYLGELTPLTAARGEARLTGEAFRAKVAAGAVGPIAVSEGDLEILDYNSPSASARIRVRTDGQVADVLKLIDQQPLGYTKRFGIDPQTTHGTSTINLDFAIPLLKDVPVERVGVGVQAKLAGLSIAVDDRRRLENGTAQVALDTKSLTSQGTGDISGVPVSFRWQESFEAGAASTRIDLTGRLDDASRAKLGLSEPTWLKGTMPVQVTFTGHRFDLADATIRADMTQAFAEFGMFNLAKRPGTPATATARVRFTPEGTIQINDLAVTGQGLQTRGSVLLHGDGRLIKVSLADMRAGSANDFALDVEPLEGGGLSIRIQGKSLDATKFFGDEEKPATPVQDRGPLVQDPLSISLRLDRVLFKDDQSFRNVSGSISFGGNDRITAFALDALSPSEGKIKGGFFVENNVRTLTLEAEDAGAFIRTFTGFTSIRGGNLSTQVSFPAAAGPRAADYTGTVTLNDIVVTDQPFLARLFAAGSFDGPLRLLQGEGIRIARLTAPFTSQGRVVMFHEGLASGPSVGGTFEGMLDRRTDQIALTGTMVPAYGINSMLGSVPILGDILASRKGEGVFGVTYSMKGPLADPTLMVNPLSVLTPGILRRIFEFRSPEMPSQEEQGPAEQPPQQPKAAP
jgi:hypothetical protein